MMMRAATTIDSFDLYRMGRLHQVLAEMLREDIDVKRASENVLRLGASGIGGIAGGFAECLRNRDDIGFCSNHRHGAAFATRPGPLGLWLVIVACMVGALGNAVFMRGGPRLLLPAAGAGALTGIVNVVLQRHASLDPTLAVGIAALMLGVVSGLSSGYLRIPSTELCIVGIAGALLPGLDVYWIIVSEVFKFSGVGEAFLRALVAVLVIGPSVVLGMWLVGRIRSNGKE